MLKMVKIIRIAPYNYTKRSIGIDFVTSLEYAVFLDLKTFKASNNLPEQFLIKGRYFTGKNNFVQVYSKASFGLGFRKTTSISYSFARFIWSESDDL